MRIFYCGEKRVLNRIFCWGFEKGSAYTQIAPQISLTARYLRDTRTDGQQLALCRYNPGCLSGVILPQTFRSKEMHTHV